MCYCRCQTVRLHVVSKELHEEAPPEDAHEFPHGTETVYLPEMRSRIFAEQQHEDALQEVHPEKSNEYLGSAGKPARLISRGATIILV